MTKSEKHCGKKRNCSFWAISSSVTMFSKSRLLHRRQKASIWEKGLTLPHNSTYVVACLRCSDTFYVLGESVPLYRSRIELKTLWQKEEWLLFHLSACHLVFLRTFPLFTVVTISFRKERKKKGESQEKNREGSRKRRCRRVAGKRWRRLPSSQERSTWKTRRQEK